MREILCPMIASIFTDDVMECLDTFHRNKIQLIFCKPWFRKCTPSRFDLSADAVSPIKEPTTHQSLMKVPKGKSGALIEQEIIAGRKDRDG